MSLENLQLQFILHADDIAVMADDGENMELGLKNIAVYLKEKHLQVNVIKTKVMNFHKGRPRHHSFFFEGSKIENGKAFTDVPNKKMGVVCNPFQLLFE